MKHNDIMFSIIVNTYNRKTYLEKCLNSLLNQNHVYVKYEVIVVDDGSTDNTQKIIRDYVANHHIIYLRQDHRGVAAAKNLGIRSSSGDVIVFLDDDLIVKPDFLKNLYSIFSSKTVDCIGFIDQPYPGDSYISKSIRYLENFSRQFWMKDKKGNLAIRRNILEKAGNFEEYRTYYLSEDDEFIYRLKKLNVKLRFSPDLVTYHRTPTITQHINLFLSQISGPSLFVTPNPIHFWRLHHGATILCFLFLIIASGLFNPVFPLILFGVGLGGLVLLSIVISYLICGNFIFVPGIILVLSIRISLIVIGTMAYLFRSIKKRRTGLSL